MEQLPPKILVSTKGSIDDNTAPAPMSTLCMAKPILRCSSTTRFRRPVYFSGSYFCRSGFHHTCGIRAGHVYCWGSDALGQLGDGAGADMTGADTHGTVRNCQFTILLSLP